ncbi:hypothetical protein TTHT_2081 [Thermotomaculum hydrothermale]|uniref:DNA repair protein RecO n=1 Tax=Thermotomaculum hydrothermale TaxID=981385 RepID=A0A7R6SZA3_9BACT|nr:DNA repair protein RecO [Thermotomaculum hydrothermale]BBB33520.1 hypothetical protein TTHT_2081 [Thermotomaculum hydrothermale]
MSVKIEKAYILKSFVINESDRVISVLNEKGEKISLVAKGGNRLKSRFQGKLEPFSFVKVEYFDRGKGGLNSLNNVELLENLQKWIKGDMKKFFALSFLNEVTDRFVYEKERNSKIFRLIKHVIDSLKDGVDLKLAISYFSIWMLKLSGVLSEFNEEIQCLNEILAKPLDKLDCKEPQTIFNFGLDLISKNSDKPLSSADMLKNLI